MKNFIRTSNFYLLGYHSQDNSIYHLGYYHQNDEQVNHKSYIFTMVEKQIWISVIWNAQKWRIWASLLQNIFTMVEENFGFQLSEMLQNKELEQVYYRMSSPWSKKIKFWISNVWNAPKWRVLASWQKILEVNILTLFPPKKISTKIQAFRPVRLKVFGCLCTWAS